MLSWAGDGDVSRIVAREQEKVWGKAGLHEYVGWDEREQEAHCGL